MLAARILQEQGIEVVGVSFKSHFFDTKRARVAAGILGIKFIEIDFSEEHLKMVKNPAHGYGKNMNPCIDCHGMMLKWAKEFLRGLTSKALEVGPRGDFDFIATGEVLGQRPMSQNKEALKTVEKIAGLENRILRPLSAKLLEETEMEKAGLVKRGRLFGIKGRSREGQIELVKKYGIIEYPNSAGGCILTDPEFSQRLIKLFDNLTESDGNDVELIKSGRVFWFKTRTDANKIRRKNILVVVGRKKEECENLEKLAKKGDIVIELKEMVGPLTIVRIFNFHFSISNEKEIELEIPRELKMSELRLGEEKDENEILKISGLLTGYYATKARGRSVKLEVHPVK